MIKVTSSAFSSEGMIPEIYTCDGEDISPPLNIGSVPDEAEGLVLMVDDPDALMETWNHWLVWNIAPDTEEILEGSVPEDGIEGITSFDGSGYGGPCPPSGTHRYFFKVYALDTKLDLPKSAKKENVELAILGHALDEGELMGKYGRA